MVSSTSNQAGSGGSERAAFKPLTQRQRSMFEELAARAAAYSVGSGANGPTGTTGTSAAVDEPSSPFDRFMHHLSMENGVIRQAPVVFFGILVTSVVTIAALIWFAFNWGYSRQIESLVTQIGTLQIQRDAVVTELGETKERLRALEGGAPSSENP